MTRARSCRLLALLAAVAIVAACGERMPPPRLAPQPFHFMTREDTAPSDEVEAAVLPQLVPVIDSLHRKVWGLPSRREKWRALVQMSPEFGGGWPYVPDTAASQPPRERVRGQFRHAVERALRPTVPYGPPPRPDTLGTNGPPRRKQPREIPSRSVMVTVMFAREDSVLVDFNLVASQGCVDGGGASSMRRYVQLFVHDARRGRWRPAALVPDVSYSYFPRDSAREACRPKGRKPIRQSWPGEPVVR